MIPYKYFYYFERARIDFDFSLATYTNKLGWTTGHDEHTYLRYQMGSGGYNYQKSQVIVRGRRSDEWEYLPGLDALCKVYMKIQVDPPFENDMIVTELYVWPGGIDEPVAMDDWPDMATVSGRYYKDAVEWPSYPPDANWTTTHFVATIADLPMIYNLVEPAWDAFKDVTEALANSDEVLKNGLLIQGAIKTSGAVGSGDAWAVEVLPLSAQVFFFNPFVNAFSTYRGVKAGGWPMVLTGLGFRNDGAEIEEGGDHRLAGWGDDIVDYIYIQKPDGTTVSTRRRTSGHFTVDSNMQITIASMPALPVGVYQLYLEKEHMGGAIDVKGHAGDWRTDDNGRIHEGQRLYFVITDEELPIEPPPPVPVVKFLERYYAPIDTRGRDVFYEGLVLGMTEFERGTNDDDGTPVLSDIEVTFDNTSQEFSKLLAEEWAKNAVVEIFIAWGGELEALKTQVFKGIVADFDLPHSTWKVKLLSTLDRYLDKTIPQYRCTAEEYANIHPSHVNRDMPEVLGTCYYAEGTTPGAVEAIYVDTVNFEYLAARSSLFAVTEVYSDGNLVDPGDYAINYKDGGRTYIQFDNDQGDAKITYNAHGYSHPEWDDNESAGGYVMNPAYVLAYVICILLGVPEADVDLDAFDALANEYEADGYSQDGYLIVQDAKSGLTVLAELCWTYGAKLWTDLAGRITVGRKADDDLDYDILLHDQIDALEEPEKPTGFDKAINYAPYTWEHYPTANLSRGAKLATNDASIDTFGEIMPGPEWAFNWTTSEALADERVAEELDKHAFGDYRLVVPVSMDHLDDLEILDTIAYQDPFALNPSGTGAVAKLYCVSKLSYDVMSGTIKIDATDMSWALMRYLGLGDEDALPDNWADAGAYARNFAYLADETDGLFDDGEDGKRLMSE